LESRSLRKRHSAVTRALRVREVEATALELAERFAKGPTQAYGAARALFKAWSSGGVSGADDLMLDLSMRLFETEDAQKAFKGLMEATAARADKSEQEAGGKMEFAGR
jgi:hypothetical protein